MFDWFSSQRNNMRTSHHAFWTWTQTRISFYCFFRRYVANTDSWSLETAGQYGVSVV